MSSFSAGAISGYLGLDINPFTQGMLQAGGIARLFPEVVQSFLANPLLGLVDVAKQAGEAIKAVAGRFDNLGEKAEAAGVSAEFLRDVGAAAKDAGSSLEGLGDMMKFLNKSTAEARAGNKDTIADFHKLGITMADIRGSTPEELFYKVADGMKGLGSAAEKTAVSMGLLGRGGSESIAFLSQGSGKIKEFANLVGQLHDFNAAKMAGMGDSWSRLGVIIGEAWDAVKEALAQPIMQYVLDHSEELLGTIKDLTSSLKTLATGFGGELLSGFMGFVAILKIAADNIETTTRLVLGLLGAIAGFKAGSVLPGYGNLIGMGIGAGLGEIEAQRIINKAHASGGDNNIEVNINGRGLSDGQTASAAGRALTRRLDSEFDRQRREMEGAAIGERVRTGL